VARVVASISDPNPKVNGGGFRVLRRRGVEVVVGVLRDEATRLNEGFLTLNRAGRPFVTLKGAASLDGRIATESGDSKWITSASARRHARLLRAENEAVLVGIETVLSDDPRLNRRPRLPGAAPLLRAVADTRLRIPVDSRLVRTPSEGPLVVFAGARAPEAKRRALSAAGVSVVALPTRRGRLDLAALLAALGERGVGRLLVEGGGELHAGFLEAGLADRLVLYVAPRLLGGRAARPLVGGRGVRSVAEAVSLRGARCARVGDGWLLTGALRRPRSRR
jgi:diaminohydroxyphosphoribosylaminopyrimidine deaminase/5-amino-6-(5-phosphoribosylamino)uracil reductase